MSRNKQNSNLPTYDQLMKPVIQALVDLGGSGSIEEINNRVFEITKLSDDILKIPHGEDGSLGEVEYRLAWTRTYLKKYGLLNNSNRGIWALTKNDINPNSIDEDVIKKTVKEQDNKNVIENKSIEQDDQVDLIDDWKQKLINTLLTIKPDAFERLAQRILRESGFIQVEITGKSGDGGIDGKGIITISKLISFHVVFQCKRYRGSVTPNQIRDFRGAMQGRADKGLFITTGTFTRDAIKEATRDGAPPIDLIDGDSFCNKLKELELGVKTKQIEAVSIDDDWFKNI